MSWDPDAAATSSSSGWTPMISSACLPIDPVAPRSATRFMPKSLGLPQGEDGEVRRGGREEQRVDAVEHATVAEEEPPRVLRAEVAFHERLEEVAERCRGDDDGSENQGAPRVREHRFLVEGDECRENARDRADDEALP